MLTLQNVLLPSAGTCEESALYYRTETGDQQSCLMQEDGLAAANGCTVRFDTYFGGLTIEKWKKR